MALFRALDQSLMGGQILIDDVDIAKIPLVELRDALRLVNFEIIVNPLSLRLLQHDPF